MIIKWSAKRKFISFFLFMISLCPRSLWVLDCLELQICPLVFWETVISNVFMKLSLSLDTWNKAKWIDLKMTVSGFFLSAVTLDEGLAALAKRSNTHGLFCFSLSLSSFLPASLVVVLALIVRVCARLCCVCTPLTACACLWLAFVMPFVIWPRWCASAIFVFCLAIVRVYLFACLCVALWLPLPGQYFYFQEVLPVLAAKHCIMQANAELHQSILAKQKKRFGEEIARLQVHGLTYILIKINWVPWSFI